MCFENSFLLLKGIKDNALNRLHRGSPRRPSPFFSAVPGGRQAGNCRGGFLEVNKVAAKDHHLRWFRCQVALPTVPTCSQPTVTDCRPSRLAGWLATHSDRTPVLRNRKWPASPPPSSCHALHFHTPPPRPRHHTRRDWRDSLESVERMYRAAAAAEHAKQYAVHAV